MKSEETIFNPIFHLINDLVVISNYIIKSPPKEKLSNALVRWCMRWFVLYYDRPLRKCWLLYYANEEAYRGGNEPKGKIDMKHTKIKRHKGALRKYEYVIDIITVDRTYYLCFLNRKIYEEWFRKLEGVHQDMWANEMKCAIIDITDRNDVDKTNEIINNNEIKNEETEEPLNMESWESEEKIRLISGECDHDTKIDSDRNMNDDNANDDNDTQDVDDEWTAQSSIKNISNKRSHFCSAKWQYSITPNILNDNDDDDEVYMTPRSNPRTSANLTLPVSSKTDNESFERCDSLPNLSVPFSPGLNTHFEILARLKAAAAKRPSLVNGYDMGGFSGPKFLFTGNVT